MLGMTMSHVLEQLADINYRPLNPRSYSPNIGMIGCGGITRYHLQAYQTAKLRVTAVCDLEIAKAELRRGSLFSAGQDLRRLSPTAGR